MKAQFLYKASATSSPSYELWSNEFNYFPSEMEPSNCLYERFNIIKCEDNKDTHQVINQASYIGKEGFNATN